MSIVVKDGRIFDVRAGFVPVRRGQALVDLRRLTVLPGLIDSHTHLSEELGPESYTERFFMSPAALSRVRFVMKDGRVYRRTDEPDEPLR